MSDLHDDWRLHFAADADLEARRRTVSDDLARIREQARAQALSAWVSQRLTARRWELSAEDRAIFAEGGILADEVCPICLAPLDAAGWCAAGHNRPDGSV